MHIIFLKILYAIVFSKAGLDVIYYLFALYYMYMSKDLNACRDVHCMCDTSIKTQFDQS